MVTALNRNNGLVLVWFGWQLPVCCVPWFEMHAQRYWLYVLHARFYIILNRFVTCCKCHPLLLTYWLFFGEYSDLANWRRACTSWKGESSKEETCVTKRHIWIPGHPQDFEHTPLHEICWVTVCLLCIMLAFSYCQLIYSSPHLISTSLIDKVVVSDNLVEAMWTLISFPFIFVQRLEPEFQLTRC